MRSDRRSSRGDNRRTAARVSDLNTGRAEARSHRPFRVAEEIRRALADIVARCDFHDPELSGHTVTISEVRISPDLRRASVYVWPLAVSHSATTSEGDTALVTAERLRQGLQRAEPFLRHQLGQAIYVRALPKLDFVLDTVFDQAQRMDTVLNALAQTHHDTPSQDDQT